MKKLLMGLGVVGMLIAWVGGAILIGRLTGSIWIGLGYYAVFPVIVCGGFEKYRKAINW